MTRRRGREASERRSRIGGDERQPVMARLTARWRRSNLVVLVTLKKGNYSGKVYVRRGRRKALYKTEIQRGPMRKQRDSVRPLDVGRTWPSEKIHVLKRKECGQK